MPTGYTHSIKDGISFDEFVMNCAKAFGALITMRDSPSDAEIPDEFKPTGYHIEKLAELQPKLETLKAMTVDEATKRARAEYDEKITYNNRQIEEHNELRQKYNDMLVKAKNWEPPSADHQGLKDFMIHQISGSIDADCSTEYYEKSLELLTGEQWISTETQLILEDTVYHTKEHQAEVERVNGRNKWVKQLRDSLQS